MTTAAPLTTSIMCHRQARMPAKSSKFQSNIRIIGLAFGHACSLVVKTRLAASPFQKQAQPAIINRID